MKISLLFIFLLGGLHLGFSQEVQNPETTPYNYVEMEKEFDLLVDVSFVNPECSDKKVNYYSVIIGTAVIGENIERITVLVPCLGNEFVQGDLITIKSLKTPKKNIAYLNRTFQRGEEEVVQILGSEFRATWGEVIKIL